MCTAGLLPVPLALTNPLPFRFASVARVVPRAWQLRELCQRGVMAGETVATVGGSCAGAFKAALTKLDDRLTRIVIDLDGIEVEGDTRALR